MLKKIPLGILFIFLILLLSMVPVKVGGTGKSGDILSGKSFVDRSGNLIAVNPGFNSIISLSAVHTENLYFIGASKNITGVDRGSIFPFEVNKKQKYDISKPYDVEEIIRINPDYVLIEPSMIPRFNKPLSRLETAGISVVNLMSESLEDFDYYIRKLGILTSCNTESSLSQFKRDIGLLEENFRKHSDRKSVFVETSERGYYTLSNNSLLYRIFTLSGVEIINPQKNLLQKDQEYVKAGFNFIKDNNRNIDYYFTVTGPGFLGASRNSVSQNSRYNSIDAVKNGNFMELSSVFFNYTFRIIDGVKEINRAVYGSEYSYEGDKKLTRELFARTVYNYLNLETFTVTDTGYYDFKKYNHLYGSFQDVYYLDKDFNDIETVVMHGFLKPFKEGETEFFNRKSSITVPDLEQFFYLYKDFNSDEILNLFKQLNLEGQDVFSVSDLLKILNFLQGESV